MVSLFNTSIFVARFVGVAQLDSASDSDSEGRGFESLRLHLIVAMRTPEYSSVKSGYFKVFSDFFVLEISMQDSEETYHSGTYKDIMEWVKANYGFKVTSECIFFHSVASPKIVLRIPVNEETTSKDAA